MYTGYTVVYKEYGIDGYTVVYKEKGIDGCTSSHLVSVSS